MFGFIGKCMQTSIVHLLMCTNSSKFRITSIRDDQFNIKSGEYIHATLEPITPGSKTYGIEVLFGRSFKPDMTRRRLSEIHVNTLTLLVEITNSNLTHNETQTYDDMWSRSYRSVSSIFNESSYGAVKFQENISETRTISITPYASQNTGCNIADISKDLIERASIEADNYTPVLTFSRVEFVIHRDFGAICDNVIPEGLGTIACRAGDFCYSVIRKNTVFTRAHELGHTFGMGHAYGCQPVLGACASPFEYGDMTSLMGGGSSGNTRKTTGGFAAPDRITAGWLGDLHITNIADSATDRRFEVGALSVWPSEKPHAIRFPSRCQSVGIFTGDNCETILSYRVPVGVDNDIRGGGYSSTVSVHIWQPNQNTTTLLVANLNQAESYQVNAGQVVFVSETFSTHAVITVCRPNSANTDSCGAPQTKSPDLIIMWVIIGVVIAGIIALVGYIVYVHIKRTKSIY